MKRIRFLTLVLFTLLLVLCMSAAYAADVRPLALDPDKTDLNNGEFRLTITDPDQVDHGGYFTASLYLEDRYDAEQIRSLASGDKVLVNGKTWTVRELVVHEPEGPDEGASYEIYTEEENPGYIAFLPAPDGTFRCLTDDWSPVTRVGEVKVMLPLPDRFEYIRVSSGEEEDPRDMWAFLTDLGTDRFVAYNTSCVFEDGTLVRVTHASYPEGPEEESSEAEIPAESSEGTPVWKFCHGLREGLETAVITGYTVDCEAGLIPVEMSPEEVEDVRRLAIDGVVTDKANDDSLTGNTWVYSFESPDGKHLLSIKMYRGLIVAVDGMYHYHR